MDLLVHRQMPRLGSRVGAAWVLALVRPLSRVHAQVARQMSVGLQPYPIAAAAAAAAAAVATKNDEATRPHGQVKSKRWETPTYRAGVDAARPRALKLFLPYRRASSVPGDSDSQRLCTLAGCSPVPKEEHGPCAADSFIRRLTQLHT